MATSRSEVAPVRRFARILIANRGEIAVRIIRACRELDIGTVAIYSDADREALHVLCADEARHVGPSPSSQSYLRGDRILDIARQTGADAIHPGYGFLSENAEFARACRDAGIAFIGPEADVIERMGEKTAARREAVAAGVPVVPGTLEPIDAPGLLRAEAERIGFPLMLKAAAGGGGKGLRLVASASELDAAIERARSEAGNAFGDSRIYIERAVVKPRHIEIQVLADHYGHAVHLFERECSIQRRHQKVIEESPSPFVTPELRSRMGELALALVKRTGYTNAGTLEFLVDETREPYFLEMNTRLQVEHPVTEMVTGVDLVRWQIAIARGERLELDQAALTQHGHAIECRVYAEDPERGFLPSPGVIRELRVPSGPGIRDDGGVYQGFEVPVDYDPLISKLVAHGRDRPEAIERMRRAVREYRVAGIRTTLPFFETTLRHPDFASGEFDTGFVASCYTPSSPSPAAVRDAAIAAAVYVHTRRETSGGEPEGTQSPWWRRGLAESHRTS